MQSVNKHVDKSNNPPLNRLRLSRWATLAIVGVLSLIGVAKPAFAYDLPNPPSLPFTDSASGVTYSHVIYSDTDNNGTYSVIYYNNTALTPNQREATGNGCPNQGGVLTGYGNGHNWVAISTTGQIASTPCDYFTADTSKTVYAVLSTASGSARANDFQGFYGCSSTFTGCSGEGTYFAQFDGAYLQAGGNTATNIHSDLPLYDWGNLGGGSSPGCVLNCAPTNTTTRIVSMSPANGTTTSNPVSFGLHLYINPADVGNVIKINIDLFNIDQNVLLLGGTGLAPGDIQLFFGVATTTGDWYYATSMYLGEGNYRLHASINSCATLYGTCLFDTSLGGLTGVNLDQSNQFIVGHATFIGNISQQSFSAINDIFASTSATSTTALATTCNPIGGSFDISSCLAYLFIPDAGALSTAMGNFKDGFLTRVPWGYATRFFVLLSGSATSTLPAIQLTLPSSFPAGLAGVQLVNLDQWSAFSSTSMLSTATSSTGATIWDTVTPIWNTVVLFAFAVGVVHELIGFFGGGEGDPRTETDSISTPEVLPGGRKSGIVHTTTRRKKYKR